MAFDPDLVDRMEAALVALGQRPERRRMFGGIALMIGGNMSFGTSRDELHVRVGPDQYEAALAKIGAREMDLTGRVMKGWVTVDGPSDLDDDALADWARMTADFVTTLPVK
ncbi:RNA methyltransferase TrmH, group 3 [Maricaulis maris MCS10]|jgi:TfoX/Sxy family transcriptional regulator of competence genes|uniref:RNA methyltransferase TrmH, group 3 n=1 Tax=Maricaulis maris (strain MCS10) TaxID=394221 RepID=Q0AS24_MARMM|nr:TfoX/Sxy family protein [Maricaulis maris]ABI64913.1 RNA methyltransferase TrmH, group 3 [Maricaulis maris MCS10]